MAMTKAEQRAAAERILAKHPLTPEEQRRFEMVSRTPDEYEPPSEKGRVCAECGASFGDDLDSKGQVKVSALEKFADHQAWHNASPAQWTEAYNRIKNIRSGADATTA